MKQNDDSKELGQLNYQAYYGRKNGDGFYFNFDLSLLINNFSFTDFIATANNTEHGGFLVITNNQYIIGYTAEFGIGTHRATFARVMKDITGGGIIRNDLEIKKQSSNCLTNFITARITYDYRGTNESRMPIYNGAIYFKLPENNTITKEQFEMFKNFYNDYNKEINTLIRKYGIKKFSIQYERLDDEGTKVIKTIDNLDEIYSYLETRIDNNKILTINNEIILGTKTNPKTKKLK